MNKHDWIQSMRSIAVTSYKLSVFSSEELDGDRIYHHHGESGSFPSVRGARRLHVDGMGGLRMRHYVAIKPGTSEVLGGHFSSDFEAMERESLRLGGVVCSNMFLQSKYGVRTTYGLTPLPGQTVSVQKPKSTKYTKAVAVASKKEVARG